MAENTNPNDPTAGDPYGAEWQQQMLQKLAPQVEAQIARSFPHSRGARFGAKAAILAKAMAKLQLEIGLQAASRSAAYKEQLRREEVSRKADQDRFSREQGERVRQENEKRMNESRQRTDYDWALRDYQEKQLQAKKDEDYRQLVRENYNPAAADKGVSVAQEKHKLMYPVEPQAPGIGEALVAGAKNIYNFFKKDRGFQPAGEATAQAPDLFNQGSTQSRVAPNPMAKFEDKPDFATERGFRPTFNPVASERGGSEVASLGAVKGPGTGANPVAAAGGPPGSWQWSDFNGRRQPFFIPEGGSDRYLTPGGSNLDAELRVNAPTIPGTKQSNPNFNYQQYKSRIGDPLASRTVPKEVGANPTSTPGFFSNPLPSEYGGGGLDFLKKETDRYRSAKYGDFDPYTPGNRNPGTPARDWSGDINAGTPNQFGKVWSDAKNRTRDIYSGFKSAFSF